MGQFNYCACAAHHPQSTYAAQHQGDRRERGLSPYKPRPTCGRWIVRMIIYTRIYIYICSWSSGETIINYTNYWYNEWLHTHARRKEDLINRPLQFAYLTTREHDIRKLNFAARCAHWGRCRLDEFSRMRRVQFRSIRFPFVKCSYSISYMQNKSIRYHHVAEEFFNIHCFKYTK